MEADLDPDFLDAIRVLDKKGRKEIGESISAVCESFGAPHPHRGLGIRDLGKGFYECRIGLAQRIVFQKLKDRLYFHFVGTHADVKRFLNQYK